MKNAMEIYYDVVDEFEKSRKFIIDTNFKDRVFDEVWDFLCGRGFVERYGFPQFTDAYNNFWNHLWAKHQDADNVHQTVFDKFIKTIMADYGIEGTWKND